MIFVEIAQMLLVKEIEAIDEAPEQGANEPLRVGMKIALEWVLNGGLNPSEYLRQEKGRGLNP